MSLDDYGLAIAYARADRTAKARKVFHALEEYRRNHYYPMEFIAVAYANVGELDQAFEWRSRVFETRSYLWFGHGQGPEW